MRTIIKIGINNITFFNFTRTIKTCVRHETLKTKTKGEITKTDRQKTNVFISPTLVLPVFHVKRLIYGVCFTAACFVWLP